ncbi:hypothetical protein EVAR_21079_1 [Eumeta japonica]|uniref:Uncharacterized protein n=1 Tax=Eumeta variegata TaxID=151549 RepID=A0A4C1UZZ7_EUMVA|nr:hypothetical protein EVAR_21079_1 [Eumeta japonica]
MIFDPARTPKSLIPSCVPEGDRTEDRPSAESSGRVRQCEQMLPCENTCVARAVGDGFENTSERSRRALPPADRSRSAPRGPAAGADADGKESSAIKKRRRRTADNRESPRRRLRRPRRQAEAPLDLFAKCRSHNSHFFLSNVPVISPARRTRRRGALVYVLLTDYNLTRGRLCMPLHYNTLTRIFRSVITRDVRSSRVDHPAELRSRPPATARAPVRPPRPRHEGERTTPFGLGAAPSSSSFDDLY